MEAADTNLNGTTFAIEDEDHTLANSLRFFLNKNPRVNFCGYSMPHPSEELVNLRIQSVGGTTPTQALQTACHDLKEVAQHIKQKFKEELERKTRELSDGP